MNSDSDRYSRERNRGQSETLGFILLFGMVLIAAGTVVTFGAAALDSSEGSLSADRAEKVMTQMDSEISMVALGRTDSQSIRFDRASEEKFSVDEEAGQVNIRMIDEEGGTTETIVDDVTLGAVKFERGDTVVAYQGGGVWRSDGAGSGMVSPPEFNYRDRTLTLPLVTVTGDDSFSNGAVIRKAGPSTSYFPDESEKFSNPLEDSIVQVTIESEFHHGWRSYFETRTEGEVKHDPENQRVSVNLTAPAVESFDQGAATTGEEEPQSKNNGEIIGSTRTNVSAPSVSPDVDQRIDECEDGDCTEVSSFSDSVYTEGTYFAEDGIDVEEDEIEFDTSDGDIEVVVDGELSISGNTAVDITGDGQVRFYVKGDVDVSGTPEVNTGGNPEDLLLLVHSDADVVDDNGNLQFTGFIYAPNSDFTISGGGGQDENVVGGVIAESVDAGNGVIKHENPSNFQMELGTDVNVLTFLHISTNPVTVTSN